MSVVSWDSCRAIGLQPAFVGFSEYREESTNGKTLAWRLGDQCSGPSPYRRRG